MAALAQVTTAPLQTALTQVAEVGLQLLAFLAILLVGYLIAKALAKVLDSILERVGFDRWVERGGIRKALARSKYDASGILAKIMFYGLMLVVLQMAFSVWGPNPISDLLNGVISYLPKVLAAIAIIVIASAIAAAARELIDATLGGLAYGKTLANVAAGAIVTVGVFAALNQLNIAPAIVTGLFYAVLAVVAGSAIIAIGGGGIQPMRARWEHTLARYDQEKEHIRTELRNASSEDRRLRAQMLAGEMHEQATSAEGQPVSSEPAPPSATEDPRPAPEPAEPRVGSLRSETPGATIELPEEETTHRPL